MRFSSEGFVTFERDGRRNFLAIAEGYLALPARNVILGSVSVKKSLLTLAIASFLTTLRLSAQCSPAVVVQVPLAACKSGAATAAVAGVPGATYSWTVEGGQIAGSASGDHINIALGTNATAKASVTMTSGNCVSTGSGVIALNDPFSVHVAAIPEGHTSEPLTILWAYDHGSPAQQTISGDFGFVTLSPDARSYTYTPQTSGSKQFVIDAAMKTAAAIPPPMSRQRAVAKSPVSASSCALVHTATPYNVGECSTPNVVIDGPESVLAGATFQVSVRAQPGAVATWTITNGSPATATGESVTITAGLSGTVGVVARLARGACAGQLGRDIGILAQAVCNHPTVVVSTGTVSCGKAVVNATFTGTPPFHGTWSDGPEFTTNATTLSRTVTNPGSYSIAGFGDAACAGTSSGTASFTTFGPTATILGKTNSCVGTDTVTVQFDGKPPFTGCWLDGDCFNTSAMQLVKTVSTEGLNTINFGYDGTDCRLTVFGGVQGKAVQKVHLARFCQPPEFGNVVLVYASFDGYFTSPLTVRWSDGVTLTQEGNPVYRIVQPPQQTTTFTITNANDAFCSAIIDSPASVTVYASQPPDFLLGVGNVCTGVTRSVSLDTPPPPDATVHWFIDNGSIVSGQGTSSIQYKAGDIGSMTVGCTFTFSDDRCPVSTRRAAGVNGDPVGTISLSSQQIHAGETIQITYTVDSATLNSYLHDSQGQYIPFQGQCGPHITCQASYTTTQVGQTNITLEMEGFCNNPKTIWKTLTVVP